MKKLKKWLTEIFNPEDIYDLDIAGISEALNDSTVRNIWLQSVLDDLKALHIEIDKRLLSGNDFGLTDLCARRKTTQEILESILSAKRRVTQEERPNPRPQVVIDLDRVTA